MTYSYNSSHCHDEKAISPQIRASFDDGLGESDDWWSCLVFNDKLPLLDAWGWHDAPLTVWFEDKLSASGCRFTNNLVTKKACDCRIVTSLAVRAAMGISHATSAVCAALDAFVELRLVLFGASAACGYCVGLRLVLVAALQLSE
ncbi:hypothetical protein PHYSODRAFT_297039 [Phytophthora sojae]|uniref:Uncharacterized protein n=1 Tax=Phytophthora sojae (strain P6497) TaxID=1094619 RepID=G4YSA8_PHYSP|nr:hypothetical protein PHYSODRAFT_297039 [Phytophthora sojae]EGZ25339.1 hypothetical protein PHYSODRAFT_297039 [Phytophthora sojae]|eukprot:XP_009520627.1 hypothetical protein PHYSODRAFT_297039 [Phytophthora sojae]